MVAVQSSNIQAVGYTPQRLVMHVQFTDGGIYSHAGVSAAEHAAFIASPSLGCHYHQHFKHRFSVKKVH